jgi:hypothetical protein
MFQRTNWAGSLLSLAISIVAGTPTLHSQTITFTPVVLQGQTAPGTAGVFSDFLTPSSITAPGFTAPAINNSGAVVFRAALSGDSARFGIFLFSAGRLAPIVLQGQPAPGTSGGKFFLFTEPVINNAGAVVFCSGISDAPLIRSGVFLFSNGQILPIALDYQVVPGTMIGLSGFSHASINDRGDIAFSATGISPQAGQESGIFLYSGSTISIVAFPGAYGFDLPQLNNRTEVAFVELINRGPIVALEPGDVLLFSSGVITRATPPEGGAAGATPALNDQSEIAFLSQFGAGSSDRAIFLFSRGTVSVIASAGQEATNAPGKSFLRFERPSLNNLSVVAFAGFTSANEGGIFLFSKGKISRVALTGDTAPVSIGARLLSFGAPALNDSGSLAFAASLTGSSSSAGIFLAIPERSRRRP